jgi:hypothetical protein
MYAAHRDCAATSSVARWWPATGLFTVFVLLWLLLAASIAQGATRANVGAGDAIKVEGDPGGATMAEATRLRETSSRELISYRGTVQEPGQQIWYEFYTNERGRMLFEVSGRTPSCPVRATILDVRGRTLGELISDSVDALFFAVPLPREPVSNLYYLRIDADPYIACGSASYAFQLLEPLTVAVGRLRARAHGRFKVRGRYESVAVCGSTAAAASRRATTAGCGQPQTRQPPHQQAIVWHECIRWSEEVQRLSKKLASAFASLSGGHSRVAKLDRLEHEFDTARRKSHVDCSG